MNLEALASTILSTPSRILHVSGRSFVWPPSPPGGSPTWSRDEDGPWDLIAALDLGATFVTNVLIGTVAANGHTVAGGTVLRIELAMLNGAKPVPMARTIVASGFSERTDPAALVIGPTSIGLGESGTVYVADTLNSRIAAIRDALTRTTSAGTGITVSGGGALNGRLVLAMAPNGDIVTVNGDDGNMVQTTPAGAQVAVKAVDVTNTGGGTLFGLAIARNDKRIYFVNEGNNTLDLLHR